MDKSGMDSMREDYIKYAQRAFDNPKLTGDDIDKLAKHAADAEENGDILTPEDEMISSVWNLIYGADMGKAYEDVFDKKMNKKMMHKDK